MFKWIFVLLLGAYASPTQNQTNLEMVKFALIEQLTLHLDWPSGSRVKDDMYSTFRFTIFSRVNPFESGLNGEEVYIKWKLTKFESEPEIDLVGMGLTDLVYVPKDKLKELPKLLELLKGKSVLIIADGKGTAEQGAMIGVYIDREQIKFDLNARQLLSAGFKINPMLLKLAENVY